MKLLKKYFKVVHEIYDYFDYTSGKSIYPIEDYTDYNWSKSLDSTIYYFVDVDDDPIIEKYIEEYVGEEFTMFLIQDSLNLDDCLIIVSNKNFLSKNDYID